MKNLVKDIVLRLIGPEPQEAKNHLFLPDFVNIEINDDGTQTRTESGTFYRKDGSYYDAMKFRIHHWYHDVISYRDKPPLFLGPTDYKDDVIYCNTCKRGFWY